MLPLVFVLLQSLLSPEGVSVKINRALGKVSDKKSLSIQEEEILMEQ